MTFRQKARRGIFITTTRFSKEAEEYVKSISIDIKVILINGNKLARLMVEHDIGVSTSRTYQLKKVNSDYFDSERGCLIFDA